MANTNSLTLGNLAKSTDQAIRRNALSIKAQLQKLEEKFFQLRQDKDFAMSYGEEDYPQWLYDLGIIGDNSLNS